MLENVTRKTEAVMHSLKEKAYASKRGASRIFQPQVSVEVLGQASRQVQSSIRILDMSAKGIRLECALDDQIVAGDRVRLRFIKPELLKNIEVEVFTHSSTRIIQRQVYGEPDIFHIGGEFIFPSSSVQNLLVRWSSKELQASLQRRRSVWKELISNIFIRKLRGWEYHSPKSCEELLKSFKLVYSEFYRRNYIPENRARSFYRFHNLLPNAWTFLAMNKKGQVGGTVSLLPYDERFGTPATNVFPEFVDQIRAQGRKVAEVGMLAIDKDLFPKKSFVLGNVSKMKFLFQLYRVMFLHAYHILSLDTLIIMVHPKHISIYKYLHFRQVGNTRTYDNVNHAPAVLMTLNLREVLDIVRRENRALHRFFNSQKDLGPMGKNLALSAQDIDKILHMDRAAGVLTDQERCLLNSVYQDNQEIAS